MNQISSWAIKNPIPIILMFLLLTLAGMVGFSSMRINNYPDIDFPIVNVTAARPGAAPAEMEVQVTRIIEDSLAALSGVRQTTSQITDGVSMTVIQFELGTDIERATNDVRNAVSGVRANLPQDMQEPTVQRMDVTGEDLITYVVRSATLSPEQLSWYVDNELTRQLLALGGMGEVTRYGGVDREMRIELDPQRLAAYGVTAAQVSQALGNVNNNLPGGRVTVGGSERSIRTLGSASSLEQLRETLVPLPSGGSVRLDYLGDVVDKWGEPRRLARYNGQEAVTFGFKRSREASEVKVAAQVRKVIEEINASDGDVQIEVVNAKVEEIEESYFASLEALLLGAILAVVVVFIFLRDWRATLIAAVAMPLSLIPTFAILAPMDQSLNVITLLALSLTIGILVDDAIVEIENIVRHMRDGKPPYDAAFEAADEIGLAVVATTGTIIAVFAPVGFMPGIIGQFFKAFALAACISVFFSLVVARTVTPLMAAFMLKHTKHEDKDPRWMPSYLRALKWCLGHRWLVFIAGVGFLVMSFVSAGLSGMSFEFLSPKDESRAAFQVELPPGATLRQTDDLVQEVTRRLAERPEVVSTFAAIGGQEVGQATIQADMVPKGSRSMSQQEFQRIMVDELKSIPGIRIRAGIAQEGGGPGDGTSYTFSLLGDNPDKLDEVARQIEADMKGIKGLVNVVNTSAIARPEIIIKPREDAAALMGVSASAISQVVRVATIGDIDQNLPKYNLGDRQVPIRLQLTEAAREDLSIIENLRVATNTGSTVPLSAVADVEYGAGAASVARRDRARLISIKAELDGITTGAAATAVNSLASVKNLPDGVRQVAAGDEEFIREMLVGFGIAFASGLLLMYAVLTLLFKSFAYPVTIMAALPLAIGGAILGLIIMGKTFSMSALIGVLMLMGIAAKNSILLVDYVIMAERDGMSRYDAIMDAAHKRARPILMTTFAMGAGMVPIALGIGADVAFRAPMAIAVLGGLISSTFLSLLYIPAVFTIVDDVANFARRRLSRRFEDQFKPAPDSPHTLGPNNGPDA